ncbi:putative matrix-remodeling-associated protein 8 [Scophthalmus maximus]|uniref:Matrix remodeling-associated protein 8 n=1 Tax=Scophthalmus maximus TaxID=52904 RepID=A0A2U9C165_SCOMX|nr:putative matrix-remodeling-associated protein 8 [Scophthalmus maximus]
MTTLLRILAVLFLPGAWAQSGGSSSLGVVVETKNFTVPAGSEVVLPCHSPRMVWTQDRLKDRQRVVHWDLVRSSPEYSVERILDMSPGARQRVYNGFNKGRVSVPVSAFNDGNFSLVINNVVTTDRGVYTCNLHHHYCQIHQSIQIQLNVTKSVRKEKRYWDGEKTVFVVLLGSSVVLPCVNRRPLWREGLQEDQQQVAHWDFQAPGVRPDRADRLVDLYASGERRDYGPLFAQKKMSVTEDAFTLGDFSLSISALKPVDRGLYSCHLHHHYCGLSERRIFRLTVGPRPPPAAAATTTTATTAPRVFQKNEPEPKSPDHVSRLVTLLRPSPLSADVYQLWCSVFTSSQRKSGTSGPHLDQLRAGEGGLEYELRRSDRGHGIIGGDMTLDCTELRTCNLQPLNSDYKNNLLRESSLTKDCNKDCEGKLWCD